MKRPLVLACLLLAACATTMADVQPGDGHAIMIEGRTYGDIWNAAMKVANEHFEVRESDTVLGIIRAERTFSVWSSGELGGIFITPATEGATRYRVEVVNRRKSKGQISGQGWEHKVTRDIEDVL